jgi:hypothetical protein
MVESVNMIAAVQLDHKTRGTVQVSSHLPTIDHRAYIFTRGPYRHLRALHRMGHRGFYSRVQARPRTKETHRKLRP